MTSHNCRLKELQKKNVNECTEFECYSFFIVNINDFLNYFVEHFKVFSDFYFTKVIIWLTVPLRFVNIPRTMVISYKTFREIF